MFLITDKSCLQHQSSTASYLGRSPAGIGSVPVAFHSGPPSVLLTNKKTQNNKHTTITSVSYISRVQPSASILLWTFFFFFLRRAIITFPWTSRRVRARSWLSCKIASRFHQLSDHSGERSNLHPPQKTQIMMWYLNIPWIMRETQPPCLI